MIRRSGKFAYVSMSADNGNFLAHVRDMARENVFEAADDVAVVLLVDYKGVRERSTGVANRLGT